MKILFLNYSIQLLVEHDKNLMFLCFFLFSKKWHFLVTFGKIFITPLKHHKSYGSIRISKLAQSYAKFTE